MHNGDQFYIGLMSGTSMDGVDAVLIRMNGVEWLAAEAHSFIPYSGRLKADLLELQNIGHNELHRSMILSQELSYLYGRVVSQLLAEQNLSADKITAIGCHGQTIRHAPESRYSIQLADLSLLAELGGILTIGDFRSRDLAAGGQGAPLVPSFHQALFQHSSKARVVLNLGGIANISVLPPDGAAFGFDTGPGNMLMDSWMNHIWQQPYDEGGEKAEAGMVLPELLEKLLSDPYFARPYPKSTGRELFSLSWLLPQLSDGLNPNDVLRTLSEYTVQTVFDAVVSAAPDTQELYVCGGGICNQTLMKGLSRRFSEQGIQVRSTDELHLNPQWVEAAAFAWLASCWVNRVASNPYRATGARKPCVLGAGYYP